VRPASIVWFERLYLASVLVSAGNAAMQWETTTAQASSPAFVIGLQATIFAILLALTLLVSRKGNNVAKWVIVAFFAFRLVSFAYVLMVPAMMLGPLVLTVLHTLLQTMAVALLFTPSARAWLGRKDSPPTDAELRRTFD
jgi:hypothetical protein